MLHFYCTRSALHLHTKYSLVDSTQIFHGVANFYPHEFYMLNFNFSCREKSNLGLPKHRLLKRGIIFNTFFFWKNFFLLFDNFFCKTLRKNALFPQQTTFAESNSLVHQIGQANVLDAILPFYLPHEWMNASHRVTHKCTHKNNNLHIGSKIEQNFFLINIYCKGLYRAL